MSTYQRLGPGSTFGQFQIVHALGRGGMATVWKAYEPSLDRYVALKVLPTEFLHEESFAARFQREARVVAKLEHPHIVPIFAFGIEGEIPWMSMRLIGNSAGEPSDGSPSGANLASLLSGGRILPRARAVQILRAVAEALTYAHGLGVVHRDVKPQNVLVDESGRIYLADFGIARMVEGGAPLTRTGLVSGTPQYMAPEHAVGTPLDHRVDIYALGIVAYEMFTGTTPFSADTPVAILFKQVQSPIPVPPAEFVPEPMLGPLLKSLAKDPQDRWSSAVEFVAALERGLAALPPDLPTEAPTVATIALPVKPADRSSWKPFAAIAALLLVSLAGLWLWKTRTGAVEPTGPQLTVTPVAPVPTPVVEQRPAKEEVVAQAPPARKPEPQPTVARPRPTAVPKPPAITAQPPAAPAPVPAPPVDIGTAWRLGSQIPMNLAAGPVRLTSVQFKSLPNGNLEAQLEVQCALGHDQTVSYEIVILGEGGNQLATLRGEKGLDEGDKDTIKTKHQVPAGALAGARGFRVQLKSVDD